MDSTPYNGNLAIVPNACPRSRRKFPWMVFDRNPYVLRGTELYLLQINLKSNGTKGCSCAPTAGECNYGTSLRLTDR